MPWHSQLLQLNLHVFKNAGNDT